MDATNMTPTALKRWSCQDKTLPPLDQVKAIHIYDFDNTLFSSPMPNRSLWNTSTIGFLQNEDVLYKGGWWHNPNILAATGLGEEAEEARAWQGNWNETIVDLVRLSVEDPDTLTVLLTGRNETSFSDLLSKMLASKKLDFDMVCLKPASGPNGEIFGSTMFFKQALLKDIVFTYTAAEELRIYEDRPKHVKGFREFFAALNKALMSPSAPRAPFVAEVIHVAEQESVMDPTTEVTEIQKMINVNNQGILDGTAPPHAKPYKIKRSVFYTGYLIAQADCDKLKTLVKLTCPEHEVRFLANNILITPRPAPSSILDRVGGIGSKMTWKVTGIACHEGRVWAARVQPTVPGASVYTENQTPCVVLATRRTAKPIEATRIQNWQPVPDHDSFQFETTVGEKVILRVDQEVANEDEYEASFPNAKNARKHPREEDFPPLGSTQQNGSRPTKSHGRGGYQNDGYRQPTNHYSSQRGGRGSSGGNRGGQSFQQRRGNGSGRGGGGGRGRGRGGYKSLDDNVGQGYGSGGMQY